MLEHVPAWLGHAMSGLRAGADKICIAQLGLDGAVPALRLTSPAFADGGRIPPRFTADGEGVSPPLIWGEAPEDAASLALIVEDPDAPSPQPLVHAIVWDIGPGEGRLAEGAISAGAEVETGRNSYLMTGWLPPDRPRPASLCLPAVRARFGARYRRDARTLGSGRRDRRPYPRRRPAHRHLCQARDRGPR